MKLPSFRTCSRRARLFLLGAPVLFLAAVSVCGFRLYLQGQRDAGAGGDYAGWYFAEGQWHADARTVLSGLFYLAEPSAVPPGGLYASNVAPPGIQAGLGATGTNALGPGPTA